MVRNNIVIQLKNITSTERDTIETFFDAHNGGANVTAFEFYIYDSDVVLTVDPTGASTTGRKTAIFKEDTIKWTHNASCRHSASIPIMFVES